MRGTRQVSTAGEVASAHTHSFEDKRVAVHERFVRAGSPS